ncbi:MAG TPA: hypothetical protein VKQ29_16795 [Aliidongia sp.]|nr:hypothetical protein [Aliidongia sp.]
MSAPPDDAAYRRLLTRISVMEDALQHILRRLGAPEERLTTWRREAGGQGSDPVYLHLSMNEILARLKPPPRL